MHVCVLFRQSNSALAWNVEFSYCEIWKCTFTVNSASGDKKTTKTNNPAVVAAAAAAVAAE